MKEPTIAADVTVSCNYSGARRPDTEAGNGRFEGRRVRQRVSRGQRAVSPGRAARANRFAEPPGGRRGIRSRLISTVRSAIRFLNPSALIRRAAGGEQPQRRMDAGGGSPLSGDTARARPAGVSRPPHGHRPAAADDSPAELPGSRAASTARQGGWVALPMDPESLRLADKQAERVLELLRIAQTRSLQPTERREMRWLVNVGEYHVPQRLLPELRNAMDVAYRVDADMERANRLLDRAETTGLTASERQRLRDLERSMRAAVGSIWIRKRNWLNHLADGGRPSPVGRILADYMQYRILDRGSILVDKIMPRVERALSVHERVAEQPETAARPDPRATRTTELPQRSNVVPLRPSPPIELQRFAQAARHPDPHRVIVLDGGRVRAVPEAEVPRDCRAGEGAAEFKASLKARFGSFPDGLAYLELLEAEGKALRVGDVERILTKNQVLRRPTPGRVTSGPREFHLLLVGGGPRTSSQVAEEVKLLKSPAIRKDVAEIEAYGGRFAIRTTIVEKRGPDSIGMGEAWNRDQEGSVNTGAEGWGYGERLKRYCRANRDEIVEQMRPFPPALSMFLATFGGPGKSGVTDSQALPDAGSADSREESRNEAREAKWVDGTGAANPDERTGNPRMDRAATLRFQWGLEEHLNFEALKRFAEEDGWFRKRYRLEVVCDTTVTAVDASPPLGARVSIANASRAQDSVEADLVRMNTGTTLGSPLAPGQAAVEQHSYIGPMCRRGLRAFLGSRSLLDEHGRLKPGTRVLTGGSGLSLYDQLLTLGSFMGLTELDGESPNGWRVTDYAKRHHRGAILVTSNTDGKWISPRHSHSPAWTQNLKPISNAREQHALFLHNEGEEIYRAWQDICVASIAAASGMTPGQVRHEGLNTGELVELQRAENSKHFHAPPEKKTWTLYGARREAYLGTALGMGLEPDPGKAVKALEETAPLTYKGRSGYVIHRAQVYAITNPDATVSRNNRALIAVHNERFQDVTSSPAIIHSLAGELIDAGIASYTPGSYGDIDVAPAGSPGPLVFRDKSGAGVAS